MCTLGRAPAGKATSSGGQDTCRHIGKDLLLSTLDTQPGNILYPKRDKLFLVHELDGYYFPLPIGGLMPMIHIKSSLCCYLPG